MSKGSLLGNVMGTAMILLGAVQTVLNTSATVGDIQGAMSGNPIGYLLLIGGALVLVTINWGNLRRRFSPSPDDWKGRIDGWLRVGGWSRSEKREEGAEWTIVAHDPFGKELGFLVEKDTPRTLKIAFAYSFDNPVNAASHLKNDTELAEDLDLEVCRAGLLPVGLKAPLRMPQAVMEVPLNQGLTEWRFWESTNRVRTTMEQFAVIVERAKRKPTGED